VSKRGPSPGSERGPRGDLPRLAVGVDLVAVDEVRAALEHFGDRLSHSESSPTTRSRAQSGEGDVRGSYLAARFRGKGSDDEGTRAKRPAAVLAFRSRSTKRKRPAQTAAQRPRSRSCETSLSERLCREPEP